MVVQQLKLLMRRTAACGVLALVAGSVLGGCVAKDLEDVKSVKIGTHVDDWRDEVIYQLMVDRFANGDKRNDFRVDPTALGHYQGGDWQGVIDNLDYIEELGVTALWISPIILNVDADAGFHAYHGYWGVDLNRLNPHFGDLATLRKLVKEAHARDIKVILDLVTNHMGQVFYYDVNNNGQPDEWLAGGGIPGMDGASGTTKGDPVSRVTEYDPDYDPNGVQGFTSLGLNGLAPIRFFDKPDLFRVLPMPEIFQRAEAYNRRGRVTNWGCDSDDPNNRDCGCVRSRPPGVDKGAEICDQVVLGDFPGGLKDINTRNQDVRNALIDAYVRWVLETDLDGFRIDTLKHVEHDFWREWGEKVRTRLKAAGKNNFFMFGEAFDGRDRIVGSFTKKNMMDSVFYFPQYYTVFDGVFRNFGRSPGDTSYSSTAAIEEQFEDRKAQKYYSDEKQPNGITAPPSEVLVNFMDNHDVPRFLFEGAGKLACSATKNCKDALRSALTYLLTEQGIPCIYNGTEQEFSGGNDPANREPLWLSKFDTTGDTFRHIRKLIEIRKDREALRRGDVKFVWSSNRKGSEPDAGMLAFERSTDKDYALVVINVNPRQTSSTGFAGTDMVVSAPAGTQLSDLLGTVKPLTVGAGGTVKVSLPPYGSAILVKSK